MKKHEYLSNIPNDDSNSVILNEQCLILPSFPELTNGQIDFICDKIIKYVKK
jgi:dTDP-4-amino-4,6-dideoxygalactose transaminase